MDTKTNLDQPELIIGLVGPIGVDLAAVTKSLESSLSAVSYRTQTIHVMDVLSSLLPNMTDKNGSYSERYDSRIYNADKFRSETARPDALACVAISDILRIRQVENQKIEPDLDSKIARSRPLNGVAYILRQFKREEEITTLRKVYGRRFIQVSIFLDEADRRKNIIEAIKEHSTAIVTDEEAEMQAIGLIRKDFNEDQDKFGQRISDVFHLGDVFVDARSKTLIDDTVKRFIEALFGHNGLSPTKSEYGMYAAAGAALRSLDLSRQVGAAIFSKDGEVLTLGCNEVPKPFGGTYWCDDASEKFRDFEKGLDKNKSKTHQIFHDLVKRLGNLEYLSERITVKGETKQQVEYLLKDDEISSALLLDIIEFGRIIHAEMSAITDAARLGKALKGSILFCTTFPCHLCAKHIVSSGIEQVIFLEPYPKSQTKELHEDSITFRESDSSRKVYFRPFTGISPRRYRDIFEKKKRKDSTGKAQQWYHGAPSPQIEDKSSAYITNEEPAILVITDNVIQISQREIAW